MPTPGICRPVLFAKGVIESGDHRRPWRRQQGRQMIEERIEEPLRIPDAARAETVIGAPIHKLAPGGAEGPGSQMQAQADQQAEREPAGAREGALLRENLAPVLEQAIVGFQQGHWDSWVGGSGWWEPAGAREGALLREHLAPVLEQAIVGFQQVHGYSWVVGSDGWHKRARQWRCSGNRKMCLRTPWALPLHRHTSELQSLR